MAIYQDRLSADPQPRDFSKFHVTRSIWFSEIEPMGSIDLSKLKLTEVDRRQILTSHRSYTALEIGSPSKRTALEESVALFCGPNRGAARETPWACSSVG
jgi:hypothetical protein